MGGDNAPLCAIEGAGSALAADAGLALGLLGTAEALSAAQTALRTASGRVTYVTTTEVITPAEQPAMATRRKRDSSIMVGLRLVRSGEGSAFVSAGPTGALMTAGLMVFGRLAGVRRPALGSTFPNLARPEHSWFMLDIGANVDATPEDLVSYALIGSMYSSLVLGVDNPRVGLLSVGTEPQKGNEATRRAHELLGEAALNFAGNVEARDVFHGVADVVVTDGFVGNILLKGMEGLASSIAAAIRSGLRTDARSKVGGLLAGPYLRKALRRLDYTEYGGAPLFGLDGACIKCHGASNARAFAGGISVASTFVRRGALAAMATALSADAAARGRAAGAPSEPDPQ
jgi:glycerol-3-phosphate acyltransferase PlsX